MNIKELLSNMHPEFSYDDHIDLLEHIILKQHEALEKIKNIYDDLNAHEKILEKTQAEVLKMFDGEK